MGQRSQSLRDKHDRTLRSLHQELRAPAKQHASLLILDTKRHIEPTAQGHQIQPPPPHGGLLQWSTDEGPLDLRPTEDGLLFDARLEPGDILYCKQFLSSPSAEEWGRILQFFRHHMPKVPYHLPALDLSSWPARGPDGVSHEDLKHMAPCQAHCRPSLNPSNPWRPTGQTS